MRRSTRAICSVLLSAMFYLAVSAVTHAQSSAERPLLLAANQGSGFDVFEVNRFMQAAKRANMRSGPSMSYGKVGALQVGEVVWVTGEVRGDWLRIVTRRGTVAYVYAPLLTHLTRPAAANVRGVAQAHRAVWRIHNAKHEGTSFAIGARDFITALHVLLGLLGGGNDLASIKLAQEGNPVELRVNKVVAINVAHDLAYLETRKRVADYLSPVYEGGLPLEAYEDTDHLGDSLTMVGYLDNSLVHQEARKGIVHQDVHSYAFATEYPGLHGMSGSPVVNSQGKFVGVVHYAQNNMAFAMRIGYVAELLSGDSGVRCPDYSTLESCLSAGLRQVEEMARRKDVLSLYAMGSEHGEIRDIDPTFVLSMDALRKAAEMGFAPAEYELGSHLSSQGQSEEAFAWVERSAMKGNPQAVYGLGRAYLIGYGTEKNEQLGNMWLEKSRRQGFLPGE